MARELDADLQPTGNELRLTAIPGPKASTTAAGTPAVAVQNGHLYVSFSINRGFEHLQIYLLRVALNDPSLKTGLLPPKKPTSKERFIGQVQLLSREGKNTTPVIACTGEGCFVAWDDEKAGASVAFVDKDKGQNALAPRSAGEGRAACGRGSGQQRRHLVVRRIAPAHRPFDARRPGRRELAQPRERFSTAARSGCGRKAGQWYISWRDYESAHLEVFALRTECP